MLNIEVNGTQHYESADQILSDLQRTRHSARKGWDTIRIPNAEIDYDERLRRVADALAEAARERAQVSVIDSLGGITKEATGVEVVAAVV
jgi:very-short-patch-repair endonuclease